MFFSVFSCKNDFFIVTLHKFRLYCFVIMNLGNRTHQHYPLGAVQLAVQTSVFYCFIDIME